MRTRHMLASALCALVLLWGCAADEPAAPKDDDPPPPDNADVTVPCMKDNTIFDVPDDNSNGAGVYMVVGQTGSGGNRRGLIQFAVADSVLAGSTIDSVVVEMHVSLTQAVAHPVRLHKLLASWGEAGSDAGVGPGGPGSPGPGIGVPAEVGDATWLRRVYDTVSWTTPGGDFTPTASATTDVGAVGFYTWTSAALKADVQDWLDNPGNNHGWILITTETVVSAKRFSTRENATAANRPKLMLWITEP